MRKRVQAIIVKDDSILLINGKDVNGLDRHFFITGYTDYLEDDYDAIKRVLREQLEIDTDINFKFSTELLDNIKTFFVDLTDKDLSFSNNLDKIVCSNQKYVASNLSFYKFDDNLLLDNFENRYLHQLVKECIINDYNRKWVHTLENKYYTTDYSRHTLNNLKFKKEKEHIDAKTSLLKKGSTLLLTLGIGLLFNYFFLWESIGISGFIFTITFLIVSMFVLNKDVNVKKAISFIFLIPIILLSATFFIFNNYTLTNINVILLPLLITAYLISLRYIDKEIKFDFLVNIAKQLTLKPAKTFLKYFKFTKEISFNKNLKKSNTIKHVLIGFLISIPLIIVIIVLLAQADEMFNYYLNKLTTNFTFDKIVPRTITTILVTLYSFGFIWNLRYRKTNQVYKIKPVIEPVIVITILFMINIIYLLFSIVQITYLYGEGVNALPEGFTYAEYARKGFFELVAVTILNFGILISSINLVKVKTKVVNVLTKISYTFLILFTSNMLFSALYRMSLYEEAYGYTQLRIFVKVFMILIGILLFIVLLNVWIKKIPVLKLSLIATLTVYVGLNYMNVDKLIVIKNVERFEETGKIDYRYLENLSYDAFPMILESIDDKEEIELIRDNLEWNIEMKNINIDKWFEYNYYKSKFINEHTKIKDSK